MNDIDNYCSLCELAKAQLENLCAAITDEAGRAAGKRFSVWPEVNVTLEKWQVLNVTLRGPGGYSEEYVAQYSDSISCCRRFTREDFDNAVRSVTAQVLEQFHKGVLVRKWREIIERETKRAEGEEQTPVCGCAPEKVGEGAR